MTRYADPYVPLAVPQTDDIYELQRYLADEFSRISNAIVQTSVMAAYAGLTISTPTTGVANITPRKITEYDGVVPAEPNRFSSNAPDYDDLIVQESGTYAFFAQLSADIDSGQVYRISLALDDVVSDIYGEYDTSNQTGSVTMTFTGLGDLIQGEAISVYVSAGSDGATFDIISGVFHAFRVSELREARP